MEILYGASVESLEFAEYETDVIAIVNEVTAHNQQFAIPVTTPTDTATLPPTTETPTSPPPASPTPTGTPSDTPSPVPSPPTPDDFLIFLPVALNASALQ